MPSLSGIGTVRVVVHVLGQKVGYGLFDLGIGKLFGNILGASMQGEIVIKLPESPYPGFLRMDRRMIEFSRAGCQVQGFDILYGLKLADAGEGSKLAQAYLEGLDGAA
jgi:hypothetical protein